MMYYLRRIRVNGLLSTIALRELLLTLSQIGDSYTQLAGIRLDRGDANNKRKLYIASNESERAHVAGTSSLSA